MRTAIRIFVLVLSLSVLGACGSNESPAKYSLDYIPYENEDNYNDEYGLIGQDGIVFPKSFEDKTTPVVNGFFAIEEDEGYTICKMNGESYEKLANAIGYSEVGVMNDGLIPVCKYDEHIQVLDITGNVKYTLEKVDSIDVWNCYSYSCGKMRVQLNNNEYVYVDENGNNAFDKSFEWATDFDNGFAIVGIGNDKYQLINETGDTLLSFACDDPDEICLSTKYQKLSAKDDEDRYAVYSFDGKFIYLPKMVEGVYALLENEFIFKNDYNYGLMAYQDCREKIYAKYDQLVPNGKYFLGILEDDAEIVKLLDSDGMELGSFDGDEIFSPSEFGYKFPNIVKRPDDRIFLVDDKGQMIGRPENFEFDIDDIKEYAQVHNHYFPAQEINNTILSLCGDGKGIPNGEGAFFLNGESHCHSYEINYFKNSSNLEQFTGKSLYQRVIAEGVNYSIRLSYGFDEPIVRSNTDSLNRSAWLQYMEIEVSTTNIIFDITTYNNVINRLKEKGCQVIFTNSNGCIIKSNNEENVFIIKRESRNSFTITMRTYNNEYISRWITYLENKK